MSPQKLAELLFQCRPWILRFMAAKHGDRSLSQIFQRIAYPVEPFGFSFIQDSLPPALLEGIRNSLGQQAGLFNQFDDGPANSFEWVHRLEALCPA